METFLGVYATFGGLFLFFCLLEVILSYMDRDQKGTRSALKASLCAFIWPVALVIGTVIGAVRIIRFALGRD
jgi:hypothetical protein